MNTTTRLGLTALAWAALLGCSSARSAGGQTGSETGGCWNVQTPLALDAMSPLGFTADDSLSLAQGAHSARFQWQASTAHPYGPESGTGVIDLTVTSLGTAVYATTDRAQNPNQVTTEDYCAPAILSAVSVTLHTEGGAFDERFNTQLAAATSDLTTLTATLLGSHIVGNFAFDPAALGAQRLAQINVNASFGASAFSGALEAMLEESQGSSANSSVSATRVSLACWGNQPGCAE